MAMTGLRRVTGGLGLVEQTPPEAIAEEAAPGLIARVPVERRDEAVELAHWAYGALASTAYRSLRRFLPASRLAGPAFGIAIWAGFEIVGSPLLGLARTHEARPLERLALAGDHVLYGAIIEAASRQHTA